jgi:hypothetical protein
MNRTRGFVNLNRFKSGRAIKQLMKIADDKQRIRVAGRRQRSKK